MVLQVLCYESLMSLKSKCAFRSYCSCFYAWGWPEPYSHTVFDRMHASALVLQVFWCCKCKC